MPPPVVARPLLIALGLLLSASASLAAPVAPTAYPAYDFTDLGTLGGSRSEAVAINNLGQVVGWSIATDQPLSPVHATLWDRGRATDLGTLGGDTSYATDINDAGAIAGFSSTPTGNLQAVRWQGGVVQGLPHLGSGYGIAHGINQSGQIAGYSRTADNQRVPATLWQSDTTLVTLGGLSTLGNGYARAINNQGAVVGDAFGANGALRATLWAKGGVTDLGGLGSRESHAHDVNDAGQVVGESALSDTTAPLATLWRDGATLNLGTLAGDDTSRALGINQAGLIVGSSGSRARNTAHHATLWVDGQAIDLNSFLDAQAIADGWVLNFANDVNDQGWIVGLASNVKLDTSHGFLLTPRAISGVPEPGTQALMLTALLPLWLRLRKRG